MVLHVTGMKHVYNLKEWVLKWLQQGHLDFCTLFCGLMHISLEIQLLVMVNTLILRCIDYRFKVQAELVYEVCVNVKCFLLRNTPESEFYMPTFQYTVCSIFIGG
jgi:hypothetical protein